MPFTARINPPPAFFLVRSQFNHMHTSDSGHQMSVWVDVLHHSRTGGVAVVFGWAFDIETLLSGCR